MATEKTAEGIRKFAADINKLEQVIACGISNTGHVLTNVP
jgi:hypothetical protein